MFKHLSLTFSICSLCFFFFSYCLDKKKIETSELKLKNAFLIEYNSIGISSYPNYSGLWRLDNSLYTVSDKVSDRLIQIPFEDSFLKYSLLTMLNSKKAFLRHTNTFSYSSEDANANQINLDFEGITTCSKDVFYVIAERKRLLLKINMSDFTIEEMKTGLDKFINANQHLEIDRHHKTNAGLEGIAYNCDDNLIYLANERDKPYIFVFDVDNSQILSVHKPPYFENKGADISDMIFYKRHLYLCYRNNREIWKVNCQNFKTVNILSYKAVVDDEQFVYNTGERFGIVEGLYIDDNYIYLMTDNNSSQRQADNDDFRPTLFVLDNPQN